MYLRSPSSRSSMKRPAKAEIMQLHAPAHVRASIERKRKPPTIFPEGEDVVLDGSGLPGARTHLFSSWHDGPATHPYGLRYAWHLPSGHQWHPLVERHAVQPWEETESQVERDLVDAGGRKEAREGEMEIASAERAESARAETTGIKLFIFEVSLDLFDG